MPPESLAGAAGFVVEIKGAWRFKQANDTVWLPATVPGCAHTDLMRNGVISDPFYRANEREAQWIETRNWEYRVEFQAPAAWLAYEHLELEFAGLDTFAEVFLNRRSILHADNMFVGWRVPVREHLREGANELHIYFQSPINYALPLYEHSRFRYPAINDQAAKQVSIYARKAPYHYGWDWGPRLVTSGVWRPVRLRGWHQARIADVHVKTLSLTEQAARLEAQIEVVSSYDGPAELRVKISDDASSWVKVNAANLRTGAQKLTVPLIVPQPKLWWPNGLGAQHRYAVEVELTTPKGQDSQQKRIGLRALRVVNEPDAVGESFFVEVNGLPVFMKGANYVPADSFPARVTPARYDKLFADMSAAHFNMLRVWGGGYYEDDYFYELADAHGILIWQDFMFACSLYPADDEFLQNIEREAVYNVKRLRNHPSLALWCGNNEIAIAWKEWGWQQNYGYTAADRRALERGYAKLFDELLPDVVHKWDTERFYFPSSPISGWGHREEFKRGDNHFWGVWHGEWGLEEYQNFVPRFMSEYGFQSFPDITTISRFAVPSDYSLFSEVMTHHQRSSKGNGLIPRYLEEHYKPPRDFAAFLYVAQLLQAEAVKIAVEAHRRAMPFCMGTLYWQLNDCWPGASWSSVDYYGRWKAAHYAVARAYAPILVSPVLQDGRLRVYLVSDETRLRQATLHLKLQRFTGDICWRDMCEIAIAPQSSRLHFDEVLADLPDWDERDTFFHAALAVNGQVIAENVAYLTHPRFLELPPPVLEYALEQNDGGLQLRVRAGHCAKNVYLLVNDDNTAHFSDNYFDLLPGRERVIEVKSGFSLSEAASALRVITLRDSS